MSTDTPFRKTSRTPRGNSSPLPSSPSPGTGRSVTETAATDADATALTGPGNRNRDAAPAEPAPAKPSPFRRKSGFRAPKPPRYPSRPPGSPAADIQLRFPLFQRARLRRPTGPDSFLAYPIHADFMGRELHALHNLGVGLFGVAASGLPLPSFIRSASGS